MIEKYESAKARSEHLKGAALAGLRSDLEGKLSSGLDAQVLAPHPAGNPRKGALRPHAGNPSPESAPAGEKGHRS